MAKYKNKRVEAHGFTFDSKREAKRWGELLLLVKAGVISDLERQVKIALHGKNGPILTPTGRQKYYVADFVYRENGQAVVEDSKGFRTPEYILKKAILLAQGVEIKET